ncbi:small glutamine-rich tetratricopeptide repeat-containing protein alpha-like [Galleria mellonella]|uniref:Small glutamine-rich tetratricopeptide repeat-containing protein alpha-like n=1 Tax=Galleria mellonella TaxID=7137 RepID=A0ABM3MLM0_GALME|nr:small glutamine-rich tetratricopeptide repeat-containing protein alpha-like [Galleria mellonella]
MDDQKKGTSVEELKTKGNECVKEGKFIEAVLHYTHAIKMDPSNYVLYSNRSFAFLKLDQHYLSLQDANETVRIQPQWAKGYFRRAEVEAASGLYDEAIISYTRALQLEPHNPKLMDSIKNITDMQKQKQKDNQNIIWICTCLGLAAGIGVVLLDYTLTTNPTLTHPLSMVAFAFALSAVGWAIGKAVTLMNTWSAGKSLQPPEELGVKGVSDEREFIPEKKNKYSKAQARQRYKQGKL